ETGSLDDGIRLLRGLRLAHRAGEHDRTVCLAETNVVTREQRADLRIDQRKVRTHEHIEHDEFLVRLFPRDEVDLAECFSVNQHLIRRNHHGFRNLWVGNRKATNWTVEVDNARLAYEYVNRNAFLSRTAKGRIVSTLLRTRDECPAQSRQEKHSHQKMNEGVPDRILISHDSSPYYGFAVRCLLWKLNVLFLGAFDHFNRRTLRRRRGGRGHFRSGLASGAWTRTLCRAWRNRLCVFAD